ncbi:PIG-L deacetylase family protein [Nocardia takedensis]|uniref:PIG-L deacetylase family protein n=1 Tax=Nocardia TaxID=1817 RepID=UPI0024573AA4|nr:MULTISPECIES: PIG-L family deacetylase [Nocardia]
MTTLVLSPHLDDAALCAGGLIARSCQAVTSPVVTVTIFAGAPLGPLSPQAREFHQDCGLGDDAVERRRHEDAEAMSVLGAKPVWLDIPDAIYRLNGAAHRYPTRDALFGAPRGEGDVVDRAVGMILEAVPDVESIVLPLAVGGHVDHRLARLIGEAVVDELQPASTLWYEESLYESQQGGRAWRDVGTSGLSVTEVMLPDDLWALKRTAVASYSSQLKMLGFEVDEDEVSMALRAERIWEAMNLQTEPRL